jgi:hypothetical protein
MDKILFEWDHNKNIININKHGISFEEAKTVFYDDFARLIHDPDHSDDEERFILLGLSSKMNILLVSHCYSNDSSIIRIISSRKASKKEKIYYQECKT